jgi:hypothetical protein
MIHDAWLTIFKLYTLAPFFFFLVNISWLASFGLVVGIPLSPQISLLAAGQSLCLLCSVIGLGKDGFSIRHGIIIKKWTDQRVDTLGPTKIKYSRTRMVLANKTY